MLADRGGEERKRGSGTYDLMMPNRTKPVPVWGG